ncbi:MAG: DUF4190 domain-containing protein [Candidatus Sumerlaeota bacterium]
MRSAGVPPPSPSMQGQPPSFNPASPLPPSGMPLSGGAPKNNVLAIISLVCGILSLFLCCCYLWLPTGIAAIVTAFLGKKQIAESNGTQTGEKMATAGMICGIASIVIYFILTIVGLIFGSSMQGMLQQLQQKAASGGGP